MRIRWHFRFGTICCLALVALMFALLPTASLTQAQGPTPSPTPPSSLLPPNALLIYDNTTVALINISAAPLSLTDVTFSRAGGDVKYNVTNLISTLAPGHCIQVWTTSVHQIIAQPPECATRNRYAQLTVKNSYFWVASYEKEPFRPQLRNRALTICTAATKDVGRCPFYIPQGNDAQKPWKVLDPLTGNPMPAGMEIAYDADQLWIGNATPETVLQTYSLRLFYPVNGKGIVWTPTLSTWDIGPWDNRGLLVGQCIVLYVDASKVTPLLPCVPVAKTVMADQPWKLKFEVMGPREERRVACGSDKPVTGPVLCLISG